MPRTDLQQQRQALIRASHQRCVALGLTRIERPDFSPMLRGDLGIARERNRRLSTKAAPVMELLLEQIIDSNSMIVLTDAQGTVLHAVGDDDFLERACRVALAPGANWSEPSKGTNAIGTALFDERPTLVHAGEHFMHANSFLTCSAAPMFDPRGDLLGVLDVTGDHGSYHQHTMGLVRMSARMIENHWLVDACGDGLQLHFHSRSDCIDSLLEGIVAIASDGRIVGANRSAIDQIGCGAAQIRQHDVASLFGISIAAVFDQLRSALALPLQLHLPDGRQLVGSPRARRVNAVVPVQPAHAPASTQRESRRGREAAPSGDGLDHQPAAVTPVSAGEPAAPTSPAATLRQVEAALIERTLGEVDGNVSEASRRLGISRNRIYRHRRNKPHSAAIDAASQVEP